MDLLLGERDLHVYDTGSGVPVFWCHGTLNLGLPPEPLFRAGVRWLSYDRPGYGGSTPRPGRTVASAATDISHIADALGVDRFAVFGHSACSFTNSAPHALACAALLGDRVTAAGRAAKEQHEASGAEYDPEFTEADLATLQGPWSWFGKVVEPALANGPGPLIDDDLASVTPWGFDPATIQVPVLLLHGGRDGIVPASHGRWLAALDWLLR